MKKATMWVVYNFEDGKQILVNLPRSVNDEKYNNDKMDEVCSYAIETGSDVLLSFELKEDE